MIKWEYDLAVNPSRKVLKSLGEDGWELVTVIANDSRYDVYHFKRPANFMELQNELRKTWVEAIKVTFAELFNEGDP